MTTTSVRNVLFRDRTISVQKHLALERVLAFSGGQLAPNGWPRANIHTSQEVAERTGIADMVISGHQLEAYFASILTECFGEPWLRYGSLNIKFTRPGVVGETLTCTLSLTSESPEVQLTFEAVDSRGVVAAVGDATYDEARPPMHTQETAAAPRERMVLTELRPGDRYKGFSLTVTPEHNDQYLFALEDFGRDFLGGDDRKAIVHPGLLMNFANITKSPAHVAPPGTHSMFARDQLDFVSPAVVGERLDFDITVVAVYDKRERSWHEIEAAIHGEDGRLVLRRLTTAALQTPGTPIS